MIPNCQNLNKSKEYSKEKVVKIRNAIKEMKLDRESIAIILVGSFAREEASDQSDLDFYILQGNDLDAETVEEIKGKFKTILESFDIKFPSNDGAFGTIISTKELLNDIGGQEDHTYHLTRRILFLLESCWLSNEDFYNKTRTSVIESYVKNSITHHALCRFLLNDLIRYYRTVCVDFEFKTTEAGKSWGDRNIKLAFARKLMYFSGVIALAQTVQQTCEQKRAILERYFSLTPVERIIEICGQNSEKVLGMYDQFIARMSEEDFRKMLQCTTSDKGTHNSKFRDIKNLGHHFSWELVLLLEKTFPQVHPIHLAMRL